MTYDLVDQVAEIINCHWQELKLECPYCQKETVSGDAWQPLYIHGDHLGRKLDYEEFEEAFGWRFELRWTRCLSENCGGLLVRATHINREKGKDGFPVKVEGESWICVPHRGRPRAVDPHIPPEYVKDYQEAWAILNDSPKMAATLAGRIVSDLLTQEGCDQFSLGQQIDAFVSTMKPPVRVVRYFDAIKELRDIGTHTKRDHESDVIVEATREQAEWTLKSVEQLFAYFFVEPAIDKEVIQSVDQMSKKLGRETGEERRAKKAEKA
jgi:hypothetical protein